MKHATARRRDNNKRAERTIDGPRLDAAIRRRVKRLCLQPQVRDDLVSAINLEAAKRARRCPAHFRDPTAWLISVLPRCEQDAWRAIDGCPRDGRQVLKARALAKHAGGEAPLEARALEILRARGWPEKKLDWARGFLKRAPALEARPFDENIPEGPTGAAMADVHAQVKLRHFVERLAARDQQIIALKIKGLTGEEIAARLEVSGSTISLRTTALRAKFIEEVL